MNLFHAGDPFELDCDRIIELDSLEISNRLRVTSETSILVWLCGRHDSRCLVDGCSEVICGGGVVVKTTGDGAMLAFGSARSPARAAVDRRDAQTKAPDGEPIHVRIGVHTGEAVKPEAREAIRSTRRGIR